MPSVMVTDRTGVNDVIRDDGRHGGVLRRGQGLTSSPGPGVSSSTSVDDFIATATFRRWDGQTDLHTFKCR